MTAPTRLRPVDDDERDWPTDPFEKALVAEPQLQVIDRMVRCVAAMAPKKRTGKPFCYACFWGGILKPLVTPLVGWSRGEFEMAPERPRRIEPVDLAKLLSEPDPRPKPDNDTERWLRSSDAYNVVTGPWMKILHDADPGNGHGLPDINRKAEKTRTV